MSLNVLDPNPEGAPAVVLLHGLGANAASWVLQSQALAEAGMRPLAVDLPGFGESPYDGRGWSLERMAQILADWLDAHGIQRAHFCGISMGGVVAQVFARRYPEKVGRLVLINTFAALRPDSLSGWLYFLARALAVTFLGLEKQAQLVADRIFPAPEQKAQHDLLVQTISSADPRAYKAAMRALGMFDSRDWLAELKMPTLVLTGENDTTVSPARQAWLVERLPDVRQQILPGAGHGAIIDAADEVNAALIAFVQEGSS